jgi:F0F1-type ATP synthase assembly protein I
MMYGLLKALISGILIAVVSETSRRNPALGALIVSLPLVSIFAMIWLWQDTHDPERLAAHADATFWYVLPSLPMFLIIPMLLRAGMAFYPALGLGCLLTIMLYAIMIAGLRYFGITL